MGLSSSPVRSSSDWLELENVLYRFEQAWKSEPPPELESFLPAVPPARRRKLLEELVKIDLEYRWRRAAQPGAAAMPDGGFPPRPLLEDYLRRFPELGDPGPPALELLTYEYEARHSWGDRPGPDEYRTRFPVYAGKVDSALRRLDAELAAEFTRPRVASAIPVAEPPVTTVAELLGLIRDQQLLGPKEWEELVAMQSGFTEPRALAGELLRRRWLTAYQVNQLFMGRSADLRLGPYLVLDRLGAGGTGEVFKAWHQRLGRVVALKRIRPELLADPEVVSRFYREIQVISQLSHSHVVHAYDAGPYGSSHVLIMEYVEGTDLAQVVKNFGPLPVWQACEYIRQAAAGLEHAHEHGLVHRDIKPHNLLLAQAGREPAGPGAIKILDLGLARLRRPASGEAAGNATMAQTLTPEGSVLVGTADYMAPEQALDFHRADIRSDVYGLGCTFYFLLSGQPPFPGGTVIEKLWRHRQEEPLPIEQLRPDLPPGLAEVLARMLAKKPEDRYQTPRELAEALAPFAGVPAAIPLRSSWSVLRARWLSKKWRRPRLRRRHFGVAAALLLLAGLVALWQGYPHWLPPPPTPPQPPPIPSRPLSFLDQLDRLQLPIAERFDWQPEELVAVLGEQRWRHWGSVYAVAFSPDGKLVASGGNDGLVRVWDAATAEPRATLPGHLGAVRSLAFSPDGRLLASGGQDTTIKIWDPATRSQERSLRGNGDMVLALAFAPDGNLLAAAIGNALQPGPGEIKLWDLTTDRQHAALKGHAGPVHSVAFTPDGERLISGSHDGVVKVWNAADGAAVGDLATLGDGVLSVALAPDGRALAAGTGEGVIQLLDFPGGKKGNRLKVAAGVVTSLAFAPNGRALAAGTSAGIRRPVAGRVTEIKIWNTGDWSEQGSLKGAIGGVTSVSFARDSLTLASGSLDGTLRLWNTASGAEPFPRQGHLAPVNSVAFGLKDTLVASGADDGTVRLWDLKKRDSHVLRGPFGNISSVALTPDGLTLASGGMDGSVRVWDVSPGRLADTREKVVLPTKRIINSVAISANGRRVVAGGADGVRAWDLDGKEARSRALLPGRDSPEAKPLVYVQSVACSPDGRYVAATFAVGKSSSSEVWQWDLNSADNTPNRIFKGGGFCVRYDPRDGRTLAASDIEGKVTLWDAATGQQVQPPLISSVRPITSIAFAPDGRSLAAVDRLYGSLLTWDLAAPQKTWMLNPKLPGAVNEVAFAADGRHLATANSNGTVYILRVGPR